MTTDLNQTMMLRRTLHSANESINIQLDQEDTQGSNLNSKYPNVTLVLNPPDTVTVFNKITCTQ